MKLVIYKRDKRRGNREYSQIDIVINSKEISYIKDLQKYFKNISNLIKKDFEKWKT